MKRIDLRLVPALLGLLACGGSLSAQDPAVARMTFFQARPGTKAQMEVAIKKQMDWRREQKDPWRWLTWEYVSGEAGRYAVATFGHAWKDYDQPKVSPQVEEVNEGALSALSATPPVIQYLDHLEEVSAFGAAQDTPTLAEIAVFQVQFGKTVPFYEAMRQFDAALRKAGSPLRYEWFELLHGGDIPQFMLFLPRRDWAACDTSGGLLLDVLEHSVGKRKAKAIFEQFTSVVKSYQRYAVRLRPDLSCLSSPATARQP
jgi:hypothetical protein